MKITKDNVDKIIAEAIQFKLANYDEEEYCQQLRYCTRINIYCFEYHRRHPGEIREKMRRKKLGLKTCEA